MGLCLLVLLGGCAQRLPDPSLLANGIPTPTAVAPSLSLYPEDYGAAVPPVVYLAAHDIHHLLNACLAPDTHGGYFWRRWVPEEYPYTDQPVRVYDHENETIAIPWLEPQGFGGELHPFVMTRKALGDRLSPLWVGTYVNDPALAGPVQDLVCDERMTFHDAWTGRRNHSRGRSVRWLGHITVPRREPIVHLHIRSEAGLRVFLGGELVVDAIRQDTAWDWSGSHALNPGIHILRLEYVERTGPVQVELNWAYGSGEWLRQGRTTQPTVVRAGPGDHHLAIAELPPGTSLWLESRVPVAGSQYWLGAAGVPGWWRTWVQGQPGWLAAAAVTATNVPDTATFLAQWEARTGSASRAVPDPAQLCERSPPARFLILKTLTRGWHEPLSCAHVTRTQLASLIRLDGVLDYGTHPPQAGDLADLSALEDVQIRVGTHPLPPAFLPPGRYRRVRLLFTGPQILAQDGWAAGTQVERLLIQGGDWSEPEEPRIVHDFTRDSILHVVLSSAVLQGMDLQRLHLNLPVAAALPESLLVGHRDLQELQLRIRVPFESFKIQVAGPLIPDRGLSYVSMSTLLLRAVPWRTGNSRSNAALSTRLLREVPNLELLHLDVPNRPLPASLLTSLSRLKVLRLRSDLQQALQLDLTALRQLEVLELSDTNIEPAYMPSPSQQRAGEPLSMPADWLWPLPELRILRLNSKRVRLVPPDWLAHSPRLEVVELGGSNWKGLANLCLDGLPRLRQLHLNWAGPLTTHGNTAWRQDSYEWSGQLESALLVEPVPDEPCQTWTDLAALRYLHRNRDFQAAARDAPNVVWPSRPERQWERTTHRDEVAETLRLQYAVALPPGILSDPALQPTIVQLSDPELMTLPDTFPSRTDQLRTLNLNLPALMTLPDTFLEQADRLRTVTLDLPELTALPDTFLAHLSTLAIATAGEYPRNHDYWLYWTYPELRFQPSLTLSLHTPRLIALPEHLLNGPGVNLEYHGRHPDGDHPRRGDEARYTYLELALDGTMNPSESFLTQAPSLTHLSLETAQLTALPEDFLTQAPSLTHLSLELPQLTALPEDFLTQAPSLTHLSLELPQLTALPEDFLTQAPSLTHLSLELPQLTALPEGFLTRTPALTHLTLELPQLTALPEGFLARTPSLTHLTLELSQLTALPEGFLARTPALTHLTLETVQLTTLPVGFLARNGQLENLRLLNVHDLEQLPPAFLAHMPNLQEVHLTNAFVLHDLPIAFLARAPRLRELVVEARLKKLHAHFLTGSPWLDQLVLRVENAGSLPGPSALTSLWFPPTSGCRVDAENCITFPNSTSPLASLNYLCAWEEKTLLQTCMPSPYSIVSVMPCPRNFPVCGEFLVEALHGSWDVICFFAPSSGFLRCGPRHPSSMIDPEA